VIETRFEQTGDVRLEYLQAGEGPLVILLHGFPECAHSYHQQLSALADAGFHAVAPNLRGFGHSDKPHGFRSYAQHLVGADIVALISRLGYDRAHIVGHDWGGAIAWWIAMNHPQLVDRLVILNSPHPGLFLKALRGPKQLRKSWYMFFFNIPWLPEKLLRLNNYKALVKSLRKGAAQAFPDSELAPYIDSWSQPYALTAQLGYYRAAIRRLRGPSAPGPALNRTVAAPTLVIWGEGDPFLGSETAVPDRELLPDQQFQSIPGAGHFVQSTAPEQVNRSLIAFLSR
jgi:pimeloyl-ACP methyl ester carboxylesterase